MEAQATEIERLHVQLKSSAWLQQRVPRKKPSNVEGKQKPSRRKLTG